MKRCSWKESNLNYEIYQTIWYWKLISKEREKSFVLCEFEIFIFDIDLIKNTVYFYNLKLTTEERLCQTRQFKCDFLLDIHINSEPVLRNVTTGILVAPTANGIHVKEDCLPVLGGEASGLRALVGVEGFPTKPDIVLLIDTVYTVCPRSSYPFYIVTNYIKWVTTSWTDGIFMKSGPLFYYSELLHRNGKDFWYTQYWVKIYMQLIGRYIFCRNLFYLSNEKTFIFMQKL